MGYQLFSDMTADVSEALMRGMPEVAYVPMQVELGGESFTYGPGGSLTVEQFYAEQRAGKFASTSQINPMIYRRCFEQALKAGKDVLYLCFSSGMSGTLQSANLCAEELREEYPARKLIVLDTLCASVGQAMLVREAARKQQEALSIDELAAWVEENRLKICHWFTVDSFDHLKHGGRVSAAAAASDDLDGSCRALVHFNFKHRKSPFCFAFNVKGTTGRCPVPRRKPEAPAFPFRDSQAIHDEKS